MADDQQITLTLDLCLRIGELMMANGAGAADVAATMRAVARRQGLRHAEMDVTFTSLSMTYQSEEDTGQVVLLRQVKQRDLDYNDLTLLDDLVRRILGSDGVPVAEARREVARLTSTAPLRGRWSVTAGWAVMTAGVAAMLGGSWVVILCSMLAAVAIDRVQLVLQRRRLPAFYVQAAGGAVAMGVAVLVMLTGLEPDPSRLVTANIIMLLAGIGFMGALADALSGYYITATARLLEAMLSTAGIIAGVGGGLALARVLGVPILSIDTVTYDLRGLLALAAGALVAAAGFAWAVHAPARTLVPIGLLAAGAIVIARLANQEGFGPWATAVAALLVGLIGYPVARFCRVPPLVIVVSAVVPMLPGLSIYRALALMAEGGVGPTTQGILALFTAISVALGLAAGVILGEYIAQPLARTARRLERRLSGPRLAGASEPED